MKLFPIAILTTLLGCSSVPGPLGRQTIDISDFDFSTPITTILPDSYKSQQWGDGWYNIPETAFDDTNLLVRDSVHSWDTDELLWIEYRQQGTNSEDAYLSFEGQVFNAANFMTTPEGQIMLVCGYAWKIPQQDSNALIERITKKYGEPKYERASFCREYDLYTWTLEDRTVKYSVVSTDESNVLKIETEHNEQGELTDLREGKRETYINGYIFIIDAPWVEKILSAGQASGDFVYCK